MAEIISKYEKAVMENPRSKPIVPDEIRDYVYLRALRNGMPHCEITNVPLDGINHRTNLSHINHDASRRGYNVAENIQLVSCLGHILYHIRNIDNPERIGLIPDHNFYAIQKIWDSLTNYERWQLDDMSIDINLLFPNNEVSYFKKFCEEKPLPAFDPKGSEALLARLNDPLGIDGVGTYKILASGSGIPIPGLSDVPIEEWVQLKMPIMEDA